MTHCVVCHPATCFLYDVIIFYKEHIESDMRSLCSIMSSGTGQALPLKTRDSNDFGPLNTDTAGVI